MLRERFLDRHQRPGSWAVDIGAGPSRFSGKVGGPEPRHVALDLSRSMLENRDIAGRSADGADAVLGDGLHPPLKDGAFCAVALLGNALGFEGEAGGELLGAAEQLVARGGVLLVEIAPGPGERSRYLTRLPPGAVRRLVAAPAGAYVPRIDREGFLREPTRRRHSEFRRWKASELAARWAGSGFRLVETVAVAPALGADAERIGEVARDRSAWERLCELEERVGRSPQRWKDAAAVLLAAEK